MDMSDRCRFHSVRATKHVAAARGASCALPAVPICLVRQSVPDFMSMRYRTGLARSCRCLVLLAACSSITVCSGTQMRLNDEKTQRIVKEIRSAEAAFRQRRATFGGLKEPIDAGLLPESLADGLEAGHRFELRANENTYEASPCRQRRMTDTHMSDGPSMWTNLG